MARHYEARGISVDRLNVRLPSLEHLRLSAMIRHVRETIGGERDRAILFGSSLGGLCACRVAEEDARVAALVLLAPALLLIPRWRERLGENGWRAWQETGWLDTEDYAEKRMSRVDFGFVEDIEAIDKREGLWPDVRVPTLIIHGTRDEVVGVESSRAWALGKRHVRLVEVDDGHELTSSIERITREADAFLSSFLDGAGERSR